MTKKTFKNNPALQFITTPQAPDVIKEELETNAPMKKNPLYLETKSKRLQVLMQPSLYLKLKSIAGRKNVSVNELINKALELYAEKDEE